MPAVTNKQITKVFWEHTRRYPWALAIIIVAVFLAQISDLASPWLLKILVDNLSTMSPTDPATLQTLQYIIFGYLVIGVINYASYRVQGFANIYMQSRVMADLTNTAFRAAINHSYNFFEQQNYLNLYHPQDFLYTPFFCCSMV